MRSSRMERGAAKALDAQLGAEWAGDREADVSEGGPPEILADTRVGVERPAFHLRKRPVPIAAGLVPKMCRKGLPKAVLDALM